MRKIRILGVALAATLSAGCASGFMGMGKGDARFAEWDTDRDQTIGNDEFKAGFDHSEWFDERDLDDDKMLSQPEFINASTAWVLDANAFADWDTNDDNMLTQDEFRDGLFDVWDKDNDNLLDEGEIGMGMDWFD